MKKLEKKYSVAAFIDILGYKDLIENSSQTKKIELFNDLKKTINIALELSVNSTKSIFKELDNLNNETYKLADRLEVKQFSDNIYISFDYKQEDEIDLYLGIYFVSLISALYQRIMLGKGYFVRGGIANGLNMLDKNLIFSTALIKAVKIEKETIYPRITLHTELKKRINNDNPFMEATKELYVKDWAEHIFLNPFNYTSRNEELLKQLPLEEVENVIEISKNQKKLEDKIQKNYNYLTNEKDFNSKVRKHISKNIRKYKNKDSFVYEKYLWLRLFLNWVDKKKVKLLFEYI